MGDFILIKSYGLKWQGIEGFEILDTSHNIPFATLVTRNIAMVEITH